VADQAAPGTMAEAGNTGAQGLDAQIAPSYVHEAHHGRPASWVTTAIVIVGFVVGGIALQTALGRTTPIGTVLDHFGIETAHVVGHDWGAGVAWLTAILAPQRVRTLTVISVGHPLVPPTLRQYEMAWYQLFFQFADVAEATLARDDWAWLRRFSRGDGDLEQAITDLSRPGALTASLNWYRANLAPRMPRPPATLPPVTAPTMGIWSTGDHYLEREGMKNSVAFVQAAWRYEEIPGCSHWVPVDAPDRLNELLLDWLR